MSGSFDRLMLTVGLLDKITGPMRGIQRTIQQVTNNSRKAFMNTAAGVTALIAASASFAATVNPANDMNMALGEVRSLEVADDTLKRLNQAGLQYSIQFGESASNYVRSAYDIQSAIDGLEGADLPKFTTAAGTLAKATKANVTDITSYFGSMYGIFREQANGMGKSNWVEMLTGQTATAVQMFKTTGPEMKSAFESIGAGATEMGVKINEQMAVLGTLQSTMSGSEAGTKYSAFLEGLSGAQDKFGLNFSDVNGDLLPIVEIMKKIKGEMGGMGWDKSRDFLSGAFNDEAVDFIQLMGKDINKLGGDINKLGDVTGMDKATWMAKQMQNNFTRLASAVTAVSVAIWQKALPSIEPYINMMTDAASVIVEWADKYPHLAKAVGLAITVFIAFVAIAGVMNIAIGMARFAMVGLTMRFLIIKPIVWAVRAAMWALRITLIALRVATIITVIATALLSFGIFKLGAAFIGVLPKIFAFSAALLANPLTWVVVGVVALIAALVALVFYWDEVSAAVSRFFSSIGSFIDVSLFEPIKKWWMDFKGWLSVLDPFAFLGEKVDWLKNKLSWLPGIDTSTTETQEVISKAESQNETINKMVSLPGAESSQSSGESGGLFQTISNMFGGNKKSLHVEKMEVNNHGEAVRGDVLMYQLEMEAG